MSHIDEVTARRILAEGKSPAADVDRYAAQRLHEAWVFRWRGPLLEMPLGTGTWVVTDSGRCGRVMTSETTADAIARLGEVT